MSDLIQLETPEVIYRERKSRFIEPFWKEGKKPRGVLCCQFYEAKWSNGCLFACDYCYLKGTFRWQGWKGREQTVFSNQDQLLEEIEEFLMLEKPSILHTGEISDSLAVPGSDTFMARLAKRFGQQRKHTLLLLTKSDNVDVLLRAEHNGQTVIGFSINPELIAERFEIGAANTQQRLEAASRCMETGYPVMVRVDPMLPVDNWRRSYAELFDRLNEMPLHGVVVGTLRAYPGLKPKMSQELQLMLGDRDIDGRYHLPEEIRWEMYGLAFQRLTFRRIGICKESGHVWARLLKLYGQRQFLCNCKCGRA